MCRVCVLLFYECIDCSYVGAGKLYGVFGVCLYACTRDLNCFTLSTYPRMPVLLLPGKPREKMVDSSALKQYLHEAAKTVRTIHHAHADITAHATQGLREVRAARMDQMKTIDKALLEELKQHRLAARREQKKSPYEAMERVMAAAHREERQREEWEEKKRWGEERRGTGDRAGLGLGPEDTGAFLVWLVVCHSLLL